MINITMMGRSDGELHEQLMECLKQMQYSLPAVMLVKPYQGIEAGYPNDPEPAEILTSDDEVIFNFGLEGIYLSCRSSDVIRQEEKILLIGPGVIFKLDGEDNYAPFSEEEIMLTISHYMESFSRIRSGQFCIPVLVMTCDDQPEGR